MNCELPDVQAGFKKGRGTRDQIANIRWIIKKERVQEKATTFALLTMPKPSKNWKIFKEMGLSDHLTGKGQFSFESQRKAMPKKAQTTA